MPQQSASNRLAPNAGIAIGPILFIIAILGILAAAIAAGSGSFTTSTSGESNRTKASAIIEIGQNLMVGFSRVLSNGTDFSAVVLDPTNTTTTTSLFSPIGGGVAPPSVTLANDPATDKWYYPLVAIKGIGTSSGSRLAVLHVSPAVCDEINSKANATAVTSTAGASVAGAGLGDFASSTIIDDAANWPHDGKSIGCVKNSDATTSGPPAHSYFFYQVLGVQ